MKKFFLLFCGALLGCAALGAQTRIPLLDRVSGHRVSCRYTYSLSKDGAPFQEITAGSLEVEDDAFRLDGLGLQLVSDGTTRWTLDPEAREAVAEKVQPEDPVSNPALLVSQYTRYADDLVVNASGKDFLDLTLRLDSRQQARFLLRDIVFGEPQGKSDFSLTEESLPEDYLFTDLR